MEDSGRFHSMSMTRSLIAMLVLTFFVLGTQCVLAVPGKLISAELELTMAPADVDRFVKRLYAGYQAPKARYAVDVYWIHFESRYPDGATAPALAQVFVPRYGAERPSVRPLYAFGPGSTGIIDSCRPSREHVAGIRWGLYRAHVLSHAGQGTIGIMPDYLGFGDPEREQYYMVAESEAAVMLDAIRATKSLLAAKSIAGVSDTRNFVAGFSQGGHAALAAADYRKSYAPEIPLDGVIGYGPSARLPVQGVPRRCSDDPLYLSKPVRQECR